jgi:hypothetical protein
MHSSLILIVRSLVKSVSVSNKYFCSGDYNNIISNTRKLELHLGHRSLGDGDQQRRPRITKSSREDHLGTATLCNWCDKNKKCRVTNHDHFYLRIFKINVF